MARYCRRSFLGGVLAALTGWLGGQALPTAAQPPAPPNATGTAPPPGAGQPGGIALSASGLPAGLRLNSGTGLISGVGQLDGTIVWLHPDGPGRAAPGGP